MPINQPSPHHRRSIRLKGYDYTSEGGYFITMVTHQRLPLFGEVVDGEMRLNDLGIIARDTWRKNHRQCAQTATRGGKITASVHKPR